MNFESDLWNDLFKIKILKTNSRLDVALDLENLATDRFTGNYFHDEMKGMSDSTGVDLKMIRRVHLIGELT